MLISAQSGNRVLIAAKMCGMDSFVVGNQSSSGGTFRVDVDESHKTKVPEITDTGWAALRSQSKA